MDDREWCVIMSWLAVASGAFQEALDRLANLATPPEQIPAAFRRPVMPVINWPHARQPGL